MRKEQVPSLRAVWLGQELKKMRTDAGLTTRQVGAYLHISQSIISRIERGQTAPTEKEVEDYCRVCGVDDDAQIAEIMTICHDVRRKGWWDGYSEDVATTLMDRLWVESKALSIRSYTPIVLPGLLQTPEYAMAVMRSNDTNAAPEDIKRWLEVRMNRQIIVNRQNPATLSAIVDEVALRRVSVQRDVAGAQLDHLLAMTKHEHITIRILPLDAGFHASTGGGFELHTLQEPYPRVGLLETAAGDLCIEGTRIERLTRAYDSLLEASLSASASKKLIATERDRL